jgi:hypothetical protein
MLALSLPRSERPKDVYYVALGMCHSIGLHNEGGRMGEFCRTCYIIAGAV